MPYLSPISSKQALLSVLLSDDTPILVSLYPIILRSITCTHRSRLALFPPYRPSAYLYTLVMLLIRSPYIYIFYFLRPMDEGTQAQAQVGGTITNESIE